VTLDETISKLHQAGRLSGLTLFHTGSGWQAGAQVHRTEGWSVGLDRDPIVALRSALAYPLGTYTQEMTEEFTDQQEDDDLLGFGPQHEEDLIG
jgi:hypothetical protein